MKNKLGKSIGFRLENRLINRFWGPFEDRLWDKVEERFDSLWS